MCYSDQEDMQALCIFPGCYNTLQRKKNPTKQQKRPAANLRIVNIQAWLWNSPPLDFLSLTHNQEDMQAWFFPQLLHAMQMYINEILERE
jgi:hypothetical protein